MWNDLTGTWGYLSGDGYVSGISGAQQNSTYVEDDNGFYITATVPAGARLISISMKTSINNSYFTIFNGQIIPIISTDGIHIQFNHQIATSRNNNTLAGSQNIVMHNVESYFIEYMSNTGS